MSHDLERCGCKEPRDYVEALRRALRGERGGVSLGGNASEVDAFMLHFAGKQCFASGCLNSGTESIDGLHWPEKKVIRLRVCEPCSIPLLSGMDVAFVQRVDGTLLPVWEDGDLS